MDPAMSKEVIFRDFPELNDDQINACLFYAAIREEHLGIACRILYPNNWEY
jgi:uncharacterized protein (DUF433 family)